MPSSLEMVCFGAGGEFRHPPRPAAPLQRPRPLKFKSIETKDSLRLELLHGFQEYMANNGEAFRADFVEGILRRVPIGNFIFAAADNVRGGHATLQKRLVVVVERAFVILKDTGVPPARRHLPNQVS